MPEVLTSPGFGAEKKDSAKKEIEHAVSLLVDLLDPEGPYRWDLPPKPLQVGDENYQYFVCRDSAYLGQVLALTSLVRSEALPRDQQNRVEDALANIRAVNRQSGLRTPEDMVILKREFTNALYALLESAD